MQKPKHIEVTEVQLEILARLRNFFGEKGYVIRPVSKSLRRTDNDFIASYGLQKNKFVVVRPTQGGHISITPFLMKSLYNNLREEIKRATKSYPAKVIWSSRQLRSFV